jgi:hypothetical protein
MLLDFADGKRIQRDSIQNQCGDMIRFYENVQVFKTSVEEKISANKLQTQLMNYFPHCKITFDLEDCDRILRMQGAGISPSKVIELLKSNGYEAEILQ